MFISEQLSAALSHATKEKLIYSSHLYEFTIYKWLKCTENWTGGPLLHLLPPGEAWWSSTLESGEYMEALKHELFGKTTVVVTSKT